MIVIASRATAKRPVMFPSNFIAVQRPFVDAGHRLSLVGVLGSCYDILLQVQIIQQLEIGVHLVILFQSL
jgi:hypothetical protein